MDNKKPVIIIDGDNKEAERIARRLRSSVAIASVIGLVAMSGSFGNTNAEPEKEQPVVNYKTLVKYRHAAQERQKKRMVKLAENIRKTNESPKNYKNRPPVKRKRKYARAVK